MALKHRVGWDPRFIERSPWFWPLGSAARYFADHADWPSLGAYDALYAATTAQRDVPRLHFRANVRKRDKHAAGRVVVNALYDARITLAREVPTRERDWHDLFNALCFTTFPQSKLALHARQFRLLRDRIAQHAGQLPPTRTPEQDALTLFDEGGVVVVAASADATQLMAASDADRCALSARLVSERRAWVVPFGHALFEHLVEGLRCPGGCSQILALDPCPPESSALLAEVDRALAAVIADPRRFACPKECAQLRLDAFQL